MVLYMLYSYTRHAHGRQGRVYPPPGPNGHMCHLKLQHGLSDLMELRDKIWYFICYIHTPDSDMLMEGRGEFTLSLPFNFSTRPPPPTVGCLPKLGGKKSKKKTYQYVKIDSTIL